MYRFDMNGDGIFEDSSSSSCVKRSKASSIPGDYRAVLQVEDDGNKSNDTMVVHVLLDLPIAKAGNDTTIARGDTIILRGSHSTDGYGIISKYEWDIGNTGFFSTCRNGDTAVVFSLDYFSKCICVLRVTDDDGGVAYDSIQISIGYFEKLLSSSIFLPRAYHTSLAFNGTLWIISGFNPCGGGGGSTNEIWRLR